ncbi:MAG: 2-thiouracil desulfurase family protein [Planctomycetota bacterium]|jgi:uncharacterized protein YbbK (DUF523 family)
MTQEGSIILVSACLIGAETRYDGRSAAAPRVLALCRRRPFLPVCPEQLGGLPTPRERAEIEGGTGAEVLAGRARILLRPSRTDVTEAFLRGARQVEALVRRFDIREAYLKSRSPSCGVGTVAVGTETIPGDGVTTALLKELGVRTVVVEAGEA